MSLVIMSVVLIVLLTDQQAKNIKRVAKTLVRYMVLGDNGKHGRLIVL